MSRFKDGRWFAKQISGEGWFMESDAHSFYTRSAHCVCCAYVEAIEKYGGDCDLRGLSGYTCYPFLAVVVRNSRRGDSLPHDDE